jgi:hypothetical protein
VQGKTSELSLTGDDVKMDRTVTGSKKADPSSDPPPGVTKRVKVDGDGPKVPGKKDAGDQGGAGDASSQNVITRGQYQQLSTYTYCQVKKKTLVSNCS